MVNALQGDLQNTSSKIPLKSSKFNNAGHHRQGSKSNAASNMALNFTSKVQPDSLVGAGAAPDNQKFNLQPSSSGNPYRILKS